MLVLLLLLLLLSLFMMSLLLLLLLLLQSWLEAAKVVVVLLLLLLTRLNELSSLVGRSALLSPGHTFVSSMSDISTTRTKSNFTSTVKWAVVYNTGGKRNRVLIIVRPSTQNSFHNLFFLGGARSCELRPIPNRPTTSSAVLLLYSSGQGQTTRDTVACAIEHRGFEEVVPLSHAFVFVGQFMIITATSAPCRFSHLVAWGRAVVPETV